MQSIPLAEIHEAIAKIGCPTFTTLDGDTMHSRIISVCGGDDEGIYFLTMNVKPFYRQLKANPQVALCGIYPSGRKEGKNKDGQPYLEPGFFLRLTGEAREVTDEEVRKKAQAGSEPHQYALEDAERYPAMRLFCIFKGKGEIFDYDFEMENRDHKLLRTRFAFGGESVSEAGVHIDPTACIGCGACFETCTFKAIEEDGNVFRVQGEWCDECGSCIQVCPVEAIEVSETM
ncbi:4Fe-4S binding protein [Desulfoplanes formicivorans]|uniref:Pyridoxine-5-phosphate oxidase n=1 Tax=Desulfoplanes formicivorans TaxID=1592317 RepID=A0A194ABB0_9BACT|nr:4Fe-4S binding protein [Desulfoplanes formicivorans]GAU07457.1 pyridoxine-5-phosphate oxidase [Desulfoplanes formicivorans]